MKKNLSLITLLCLFLGIGAGLWAKPLVSAVSFIGTIYINLLKFLIGPVVFTSIVPTVYDSSKRKDRTLSRAVLTYVLMFLATFFLMSALVVILDPAKGFTFPATDWNGNTQPLSLKEIVINLFPSNLVTIFAETKLFAIIVFAYMIGICAAKIKNGNRLISGTVIVRDLFFKMLEYIMYLTPFAAFVLIGNTVADYGTVIIGVGLKYIATAWLGGLLTVIVVMILPV
ncbi:MAG: cation:dicarboxylase symporter family transporter, partial [Erysipelotrichaceae bacterium]|nr:cation:dicarboxylase symporter family transporter [Erysipelotrichaceae bacterium]